ncbi:hypothetical protein [uncultured Cohaesibacter sp.]|uniref:hypothetical protein n=1 Tax=uncultured Cohaesibacter sp. TaxID=1002546 RepID=UPI0029C90714|nr:hypothetical protein [uncultured Cohaesibacter sp.]
MPLQFDEFIKDNLEPRELPGPTGESNCLTFAPRGTVLVTGPDEKALLQQAIAALVAGNAVVAVAPGAKALAEKLQHAGAPVVGFDGHIDPEILGRIEGVAAVASNAEAETLKAMRLILAKRKGMLLPLVTEFDVHRYLLERHLCIDTTAAGGNATLLAAAEGKAALSTSGLNSRKYPPRSRRRSGFFVVAGQVQ